MLTTERYRALNLLVETFLRERNLDHLVSEWQHEQVQQHVLPLVVCLCTTGTATAPHEPLLSITCGSETVRVRPSTESVYLGRQCAGLKHTNVITPDHLFAADPLVHDLHCLVKKKAPGQYLLSTFVPSYTWIQANDTSDGVVLLPGAAFLVGTHIFQVLQTPLLRERHQNLPCTSTVVPLPLVRDENSEDEILASEAMPCIIECIAPPHSHLSGHKWMLQYNRGNAAFTLGTAPTNCVTLPTSDALAGATHCRIQARMGYFWLVPTSPTYYQLYPSSRSVDIAAQTPLHLVLGGSTHLILAVS